MVSKAFEKPVNNRIVDHLEKSGVMSVCHVWAGAPSCYWELLDKLQKQICWTVGPSLAASLGPLAHC